MQFLIELAQDVRKAKYWFLANIFGILLYLYYASRIWASPGEEGLPGGPGDPIIWTLSAFPVLVIFFLTNMAWLLLIINQWRRNKDWRPLIVFLFVCAFWFGAHYYDLARQYTG